MRESFSEYKKTIESNIEQFDYLYSGDIKSSKQMSYSKKIKNNSISPSFIIDVIDKIYKDSITNLVNNSKTKFNINLSFRDLKSLNLFDIPRVIEKIDVEYNYIFTNFKHENIHKSGPFPDYFYQYNNLFTYKTKIYNSPFIEKYKGEVKLYLVDKPIQSLVYSIQNMDYEIKGDKHTITYPFYYCDYKSYNVLIRDIVTNRENIINDILG